MTGKEQSDFANEYADGISWGEAKNKLFQSVNAELTPIRETFNTLQQDKSLVNDLLDAGAAKVRPLAAEMLGEIRELVGICKID